MKTKDFYWYLETTQAWVKTHPTESFIVGGIFLILIAIIAIGTGSKRRRRKKTAPDISVSSFQISPLGNDAFLKIHNAGKLAYLRRGVFKKRYDLMIKSGVNNVMLPTGKSYNMLIQNTGQVRLDKEFLLELEYSDVVGNRYVKVIDPSGRQDKSAKFISKGAAPIVSQAQISTL